MQQTVGDEEARQALDFLRCLLYTSLGVWNVNTFTTVDLTRYPSLLQQSRQSLVERNITCLLYTSRCV